VKIRSFKDLEIYQLSFKLAIELHELSLGFPKFEIFEEGSQIRRSSKSIPATIAEGWGRRYYKNEFIKYLIYALASCDETFVHLDFIFKSKYIGEGKYSDYIQRYTELGKKINKFLQMVMKDHLKPQDKEQISVDSEASGNITE
jgi:four helix bundle protein